jgi:tRNA pseudouridine(38-40) synthase
MKNINEVEANKIDIKPFKVKDKLNPDFFNSEGQLNSQIRLRLLDIADDFVKSLAVKWVKPSDIVLTGSIANYNWSKYSDVDIHIIYNFNDVYKKTEFVKDYFNSKRDIWNDTHEGLTIKNLPVEISIEDSSNPAKSSGVYSLEKNKWVKEPENMNDSELNQEYIKDFCAKQMTKFDELFDEIDNETDRKKLEILSNKVEALYEKLKNMRGEALKSKEKEMATGNIIWKVIKHQGYIERAWDYINKVYDRRNTINENKPGKIVRITNKQAKIINEVYDASKLAKFGPVKRYFHYLNLELPLKGEYELHENDPKDKRIVCKCLSAVGSPRLKAQIHDKYRSGCIFVEDLVKYLGNFQNRNMLRNAIMKEKGDFTRTVEYFRVERSGDLVTFTVAADGFLYNMVRIMVGTLLAVQQGRIPSDSIADIIKSENSKKAGPTAPACGLYLNRVFY